MTPIKMKDYIIYIIAAIAAYFLFLRKKTSKPSTGTPGPPPAQEKPGPPNITPPPSYQQPSTPSPPPSRNVSPGFPSDCPYTTAQACDEWKNKQKEIADSFQPAPTIIYEPEKPIETATPPFFAENKLAVEPDIILVKQPKPPEYQQPGTPAPGFSLESQAEAQKQAAEHAKIRAEYEEKLKISLRANQAGQAVSAKQTEQTAKRPPQVLYKNKTAAWSNF